MAKLRERLEIGRGFALPLDAVTQTFAVLGKRGSGKTNMGVVLVEEMVAHGLPVVVIDPVGVWWGLRASANRRDPGLPVIILGGEHADVPLEVSSGAVIADFIVETGKPCVLDLANMRKGEQTRFVTDFAERLYHRKAKHREALHLMVDECDSFAPQRAMPEQARLLGAMEDLVRRGRSRGIGLTMITQRPAVLNKNVLTQAEVLVVFQLTAPQDRNAIGEWVRANADDAQRAVIDAELPGLPLGDAYVWSPSWLQLLERRHVRARRTFDSSRTPEPGERVEAPRELAVVDIEALKQRIAATIESAKADRPRDLQKQVAVLEKQLREARSVAKAPPVEVPVLEPGQLAALERVTRELAQTVSGLVRALGRVMADASSSPAASPRPSPPSPPKTVPTASPAPERFRKVASAADGSMTLRKGERRMLETLVRHHPVRLTRAQLGTLSGFTASGGTFRTYFSTLVRAGYVVADGDIVEVTVAGLDTGGGAGTSPLSTEETVELWRRALRAGERRMLDVLLEAHPNEMSLDELGTRSGFEASGGTFRTYLGTLRRNGLAKTHQECVRAGDALFLGVARKKPRRNG